MSLFNKGNKIKTKVKLISLHIPKTAGTSFRNILKGVYGDEHVVRFDINKYVAVDNEELQSKKLDPKIQVIHGHFSYHKLIEQVSFPKDTPLITWLRDPVERVVSNYYYLSKILREELNEEEKDLNILAKMQRTLLEYAMAEPNRNRMSSFLEGSKLEDFLFVGIMKYYMEDLEDLSKILGWEEYPILEHNITGDKPEVDPDTLAKISELNSKDIDIYNKALQLREERMRAQS